MSRTHDYRCLNCFEEVVSRTFDTSHLSRTCPNCDSFERFANESVIERFESLEASPPAEFDWERLARREKLLVAERLARTDKTLDGFEISVDEESEADAGTGNAGDATVAGADDEGTTGAAGDTEGP